jgi:hypothetical protein
VQLSQNKRNLFKHKRYKSFAGVKGVEPSWGAVSLNPALQNLAFPLLDV